MIGKDLLTSIEREYRETTNDTTYYIPGNLVRWIPVLIQEIRRLEAELEKRAG